MADQEEPPDVVTEDVAEDTVADDNMEEAKETGKDGGTPDVFSDSTSDTSSICSDIVPEPEIICNGLRVKLGDSDLPFAGYSYATLPGVDIHPIEWTVLDDDEQVRGKHIQCHQVTGEEDLAEVIRKCSTSDEVMAMVLINTEDNYHLTHFNIPNLLPLLVLKSSDGENLLKFLHKVTEYMFAKVEIVGMENVTLELHAGFLEPTPEREPSTCKELSWQKKSEFSGWVQNMLHKDGNPVCISKDRTLFTLLMEGLTQYESLGKRSANANSKLVKILTLHRDGRMSDDFPFYVIVAYRMECIGSKQSVYQCMELTRFIYSCVEQMENLKQEEVALTLKSFLKMETDSSSESSPVMDLEKPFLYFVEKSSEKKRTDTGEYFHKYIYYRMFWISLSMRCNQMRSTVAPSYWETYFMTSCKSIQLQSEHIEEIADGLRMGKLLGLRFQWTFNPQEIAQFLCSRKPLTFLQLRKLLEAVAENLCIEADVGSSTMTVLLKQLQFQYDKWILSTSTERKDQLEALNAYGNAREAIREGLDFVDAVYKIWKAK